MNMSCAPFDIHKLNVQVVGKQLNNVNYTYIIMIFSTKLCKTSSKVFFDGKTIHGCNFYDNL